MAGRPRPGRLGSAPDRPRRRRGPDRTTPTPPGAIPINPSFLALNPEGTRLYAVHGDATSVSAFAVDPSHGTVTLLNTVDVGRGNPVYLTLDPTGHWLVVAFLAVPGSVVTLPVRADGSLGTVTGVLELPGTPGPHKTAQLGPNPHHVVFDPSGRWLAIPDRGLDQGQTHKLLVWSGNDNIDAAAQYAISTDFVQGLAGQEGADVFINTHVYQGAAYRHLLALEANPSAPNPLLMGRAGVQRHLEIFGNAHRALAQRLIDGTWKAM